MSVKLPNGTTFAIASGYGAPVTVSALSNATEAVATATNTLADGDFVEVTSGWSRLNGKVARVSGASGTGAPIGVPFVVTSVASAPDASLSASATVS